MTSTSEEYRQAAEDFRKLIGARPLEGVLVAAGCACAEARAALMRAGVADKEMDSLLQKAQRKLEQEARRE